CLVDDELSVPDGERDLHAIEIDALPHDPLARTLAGLRAGGGIAIDILQHFADDRVSEHTEVADPKNALLLGRSLAVQVDLEIQMAADHVGIEADELHD